jgi:hypothetical protein
MDDRAANAEQAEAAGRYNRGSHIDAPWFLQEEMMRETEALLTLSSHQAHTLLAVFEHLFPLSDLGHSIAEAGVLTYVDRALAGAYGDKLDTYRLGLAALDRAATILFGETFIGCSSEQQEDLLAASPTRPTAATATSWAGRYWDTPASGWRTRSRIT